MIDQKIINKMGKNPCTNLKLYGVVDDLYCD